MSAIDQETNEKLLKTQEVIQEELKEAKTEVTVQESSEKKPEEEKKEEG
jgi:hypothetical protein